MLTVAQFAAKKKISPRRVRKLIQEGRIAGALRMNARLYLVPANAKIKPPAKGT